MTLYKNLLKIRNANKTSFHSSSVYRELIRSTMVHSLSHMVRVGLRPKDPGRYIAPSL